VFVGAYFVVALYLGLKFHVMGDGDSETDFFGPYVEQARSFLSGTVIIDSFRGPLYPIAVGLLHILLRPLGLGLFETAIVLSTLSASVVLFFTHRILSRLLSPRVAAATTLLLVVNPAFFRYNYTTGNDMFFAALATLSAYFVLRSGEFRWASVILAGLFAAFCYLTRYNGFAIVVAACVCVVLINVWQETFRKRILAALVLAMTVVVLTAPWGLYTLAKRGAYFYNRNYINMAVAFYSTGEETQRFQARHADHFNNLVDVVLYDTPTFLLKIPMNAWNQTRLSMGRVMLWPSGFFILAGILALLWRRPSRRLFAYYTFGFLFFVVLWLVFFNDRFLLFLVPIFASLVAQGALGVARLARGDRRRGVIFVVLLVALLGYSLYESISYNRELIPGGPIAFRKMTEGFVAKEGPGVFGKSLVARKPYFAYFAGLKWIPLPVVQSEKELLEFMHDRNADYLLVTYIAARTRPEIYSLYDYKVKHEGFKAIGVSNIGVIYRVEKDTLGTDNP
jgi:hypothetical protein